MHLRRYIYMYMEALGVLGALGGLGGSIVILVFLGSFAVQLLLSLFLRVLCVLRV